MFCYCVKNYSNKTELTSWLNWTNTRSTSTDVTLTWPCCRTRNVSAAALRWRSRLTTFTVTLSSTPARRSLSNVSSWCSTMEQKDAPVSCQRSVRSPVGMSFNSMQFNSVQWQARSPCTELMMIITNSWEKNRI